jgi:hypothetical protein
MFCLLITELSQLKGQKIWIILENDNPIFKWPSKFSEVERPLIQDLRIELMDEGLLELSKCDYNSMTIMPTKDFWAIGMNITCVGIIVQWTNRPIQTSIPCP